MSISQLSPNSVYTNPAYVNPQVKTDQATEVSIVSQGAQKAVQAAKTDTVTISQQAVQKLASDGDSRTQEVKESGAEKAAERFRAIA